MRFAPIAIVGRACVLPGAHGPEQLWQAVAAGRDLLGTVPEGRWGLNPEAALCAPENPDPDRSWSARGGYVTGFEAIWEPQGFAVEAAQLAGLDRSVHWLLHSARAALRDAGADPGLGAAPRTGAIFGNLGFPTASMAAYAQAIWSGCAPATLDPRQRFMSSGSAELLARALALQAGSFCLDAACASSLYAIKLACDALHDGRAELMLAGAVQGSDDLFLHVGFCALNALSRSGQSRPFHADADGLLPAEGAAFVVLKRLADAQVDGDRIYGVIQGIGLSNDGRGKGLLAPAEEGQQRAMRAAYATAGFGPERVSLIECHATGTPVGDATELRSTAAVYAGLAEVPIGSLKSNLGHLITTAGVAGLIKLTEAMRAGQRPPTLHVDIPTPALLDSPFRLVKQLEAWPSAGPRVAALSAFGFGGNNAHLLVSEVGLPPISSPRDDEDGEIAIVGIGCLVATAPDRTRFTEALFSGESLLDAAGEGRMAELALDLAGLRFPPNDLAQTLPQQLTMLQAARQALAETGALPRERTGIYVGMEPDPEVARYGARWRLAETGLSPAALAAARDAVVPALESAAVLGCMPNIPANRLSAQFDLGGPAFTVQAGPASGLQALQLAARALRTGELDAALVGAVDLSCEPVQRGLSVGAPGDAAIAMVLKRLADAQRDGDRIYALLAPNSDAPCALRLGSAPGAHDLHPRFGNAYAASGLLHTAAAALALHHRRQLDGNPWLAQAPRRCVVQLADGRKLGLLEALGQPRRSEQEVPRLQIFAGADQSEVLAALRAGRESLDGPARLVLVSDAARLPQVRARALAHLEHGTPAGTGVHFRAAPLHGELAFVFAGAGAGYHGMGRELLHALPQLLELLQRRSTRLPEALAWAYGDPLTQPTATEQLWGASALSQLHLELTREVLGLRVDAWLGYSSGESNALVAAGIWNDPDALMQESEQSGLMNHQLGGEFAAVARRWGRPVHWASWTVLAPVAEVRAALREVPEVHLAIIQSDGECLIAGDAEQGARVVEILGSARCLQLRYPLAVHVPELDEIGAQWLQLHRRATTSPTHGRIYSNAWGRAYQLSEEACAQAILEQADRTLDLRPAVLKAWEDGVRIFLEHGPGSSYSRAIRSILGEREALVLSLDAKGRGLESVLNALAALLAAGVPMQLDRLQRLLAAVPAQTASGRSLRVAAHPPVVVLAKFAPAEPMMQIMQPAPRLPGIYEEPPSSPCSAAFNHYRTQLAQLAQMQQQFVEGQAAVHGRFLALRQAGLQVLLEFTHSHESSYRRTPVSILLSAPASANGPMGPGVRRGDESGEKPVFTRAQLEQHAGGSIAALFGPSFAAQDAYHRQVRMPLPPLLLADRVTKLTAVPGSMGTGCIHTETDVRPDAWYLYQGTMPAGILIEAGQADLLLISYLGVDLLNCGERVYRLLGCELTYHGDLPRRGDTLNFVIEIDGHAAQEQLRLMFFHYQCQNAGRPQLSVRQGQAGFFSDAELANSAGCLWSPENQAIVAEPRLDAPLCAAPSSYAPAQLQAFAAGDAYGCFGAGFELAQTHTRSPAIQTGAMLLLERITALQPRGGPWQRGYLRAELAIRSEHWFFAGHFKNDPCMPGTLMFEGCLQAMAFYLAAQGYTLARDGWRFQPVPELPYALQCRGQVTPSSRLLVTEVFVEECLAGPIPTVYADLLCTVDGLKAFHARRVALQLVPGWPLDGAPELEPDTGPVADVAGFRFGQRSLLACAQGRPSEAFGPIYQRFDGPMRVARLPSPPYLFMSRIAEVHGQIGVMRAGARVIAEYDIPADAWYFAENGARTMPFAVLLEAALQPCGWLSSYIGSALTVDEELGFRNLDGTGTLLAELQPGSGTLRTEVEVLEVSATAGMIIESFAVRCFLGASEVYRLRTVFGFFPPATLAAQAGLRTGEAERELLNRASDFQVDLHSRPARYFPAHGAALATDRLLVLDVIDGYWPATPEHGTQLRARKTISPDAWFFKAHFFQDPVQPGSLGLEAMLQTLQFYMLHSGLDVGIADAHFVPIELGVEHQWKYRGQVLPKHRSMQTTLEITAFGRDAQGSFARARASLWADGQRIYEAENLGMRMVPLRANNP